MNYLRLAQNMLDGYGLNILSADGERIFFAIWPIAYPSLIYLIALVTGLSVFWSSKVLSIILFGISLVLIEKIFKSKSIYIAMILLFSTFIEVFSYSWSESLFIVAILWFAFSLIELLNTKGSFWVFLQILLASLLLFLTRYIGAFSVGVIGLVALYLFFKKERKYEGIILIGIVLFNVVIMGAYLYHNYTLTGFPTGMQRIAAPESFFELIGSLLFSILVELSVAVQSLSLMAIAFLLFEILLIAIVYYKVKVHALEKKNLTTNTTNTINVLLLTGGTYLASVIVLRFLSQFDPFGFRLFAPGELLIFAAFVYWALYRFNENFTKPFVMLLFLLASLSVLLNGPYKIFKALKQPNYFEQIEHLQVYNSSLHDKDIIIFAPPHLRYLNAQVIAAAPFTTPLHEKKESWKEFMGRINANKNKFFYLNVPKNKEWVKAFDTSVQEIFNTLDPGVYKCSFNEKLMCKAIK